MFHCNFVFNNNADKNIEVFDRINCSENVHSLKKIASRKFFKNFNHPKVFKKHFFALNHRNEQSLSKEENEFNTRDLLIVLSWNHPHIIKYNKCQFQGNFWDSWIIFAPSMLKNVIFWY